MMHIVSSLAIGLSLLSFTSATGTLQLDFKRDEELSRRLLRKRQSSTIPSTTLQLVNGIIYFADVSIGNPPQSLKLQLDTGSSDVFTVAPNVTGISGGSFDPSKSSTFDDILPGNFSAAYGDGSKVTGDYFTDQLTVGGVTIDNFQMGLGLVANTGNGILGIGFGLGEATPDEYPTLVETMVSENLISTTAYSVFLNDYEAGSGAILFGGIDTAKYTGAISNIAMYPSQFDGVINAMTVSLTSLSVTSASGTTDIDFAPLAVILDTGSSDSVLPDEIVSQLYSITGAIWNSQLKMNGVLCSTRSMQGSFTFGFAGTNGPKITVPISEFILPILVNNSPIPATLFFPHAKADDTICRVAAIPRSLLGVGKLGALLGDPFLRSAYVVFDLANKRVGMAQAKFNSTESNVVPFASSGAAIPSASSVSEVSLTYTVTGTAAVTSAPSFVQTAPFFSGSAGPAFASVVAAGEAGNITATATQSTSSPTPSTRSSSASTLRVYSWNSLVLMEAVVGFLAVTFAVLM